MTRILWTLCLLLMPVIGSASPLDEAEQAMRQNQTRQAIALAEAYQPADRAEIVRKLWLLGVGNNRLGRPRAAIESLDRLVALVPGDPVMYRLELAAALLRAGQADRARYHLAVSKGAGLDSATQAQVQAGIDSIDRSRDWQGYVQFALVPESNAARRTAAETVDLGGLRFTLRPDSRQEAATGAELGFGLAALPELGRDFRGRVGIDAFTRVFDSDTIAQDTTVRISAALLHFGDRGRQLSFGAFASQRWLDSDVYTQSEGLDLRYSRTITDRMTFHGYLSQERLRYDQPTYAVDKTSARLHFSYATTAQLQLNLSLRGEDRNSANLFASGQAAGISLGGQYSFAGGLRADLVLSNDTNSYDGIDRLFGVKRSDRKVSATVTLTNQNWSYYGFAPQLRLGVERQQSSIVVNEYQNTSVSVGLTRQF